MALSVKSLYDACVNGFTTSAYSDHFEQDFLFSLNRVLDQLTVAMHMTANSGSAIAHVDSTDTTISELTEDYFDIVMTGLELLLKDFGNMNPRMGPQMYRESRLAWEEAKGMAMVKKSHSDQSSKDDDNNNSNDIIAHGNFDNAPLGPSNG